MATAFADALDRTTLRTSGEVKLDPTAQVVVRDGSVVGIEPNASVKLDANGTIVKLDSNAKINIVGTEPYAPRPTLDQLKPQAAPLSRTAVVTNYTVFKNVQYNEGRIVTGWNFSSNEENSPNSQYCYYYYTVESGISVKLDLATDGVLLPKTKPLKGLQAEQAAANCVWFAGGATKSTSI